MKLTARPALRPVRTLAPAQLACYLLAVSHRAHAGVTLLFVVPPRNSVASFAKSIQDQLGTASTPQIVVQPAGEVLSPAMSVAEAHRRYAATGVRMQVSVRLRSGT